MKIDKAPGHLADVSAVSLQYFFQFAQHGLGEAVDVAQHIVVDAARRLRHHHEVIVIEVDVAVEVVHSLLYELRQVRVILQTLGELDVLDE